MVKKISLYLMAGLYTAAGINHFIQPGMYMRIMPPWLVWHKGFIIVSGVCEILFGLLLIPCRTRQIAAWCIIVLLVAIFPANVQMMVNYLHEDNRQLWLAIFRMPLQLVLIWWAYLFTNPAENKL
jgi:uncharacterized membrane protein